MNTRRYTIRREEGGVANERIPPRIDHVPIVFLEGENEEVPLVGSQVPPKHQEAQVPEMPSMPQDPFVERDMNTAK